MDDLPPKPGPAPNAARPDAPHPNSRAAQREARLKVALKANMARRKAQARGRADIGGVPADDNDNTNL